MPTLIRTSTLTRPRRRIGHLVTALGVPATPPTDYYTTNFPASENPMLEGGIWTEGLTDGLDWHNNRTTTNKVFGTQSGATIIYDDSISVLKGSFTSDQMATAVVFSTTPSNGSYFAEVELLLRFSLTAHDARGYECVFNTNAAYNYIGIAKWLGPLGTYAVPQTFDLTPGATGPVVQNGDIIKATIIGNTITMYINGVQAVQATDSIGFSGTAPYTTGNPGIGHWSRDNGAAQDGTDHGFTSYTAQSIRPAGPSLYRHYRKFRRRR